MKDLFSFEKDNKELLDRFDEWIFIRMNYHFKYINQRFNKYYKNQNKQNIFFIVLFHINNAFYGFKNWFKRYNYIIISDSSQRKFVHGKYYDRLFDYIAENLDLRKTLIIEIPNKSHRDIEEVYTKHIVSYSLILLLASFFKKFYLVLTNKSEIIKGFKLYKLFNKNDLSDYINTIVFQKALYRIFLIFFKLNKIKILFISCYYGKEGIIKAAKKYGIKVIEIQHGVIGKQHPAYNSTINLTEECIPDMLLTFGHEGGYNEFIIKDVVPVGSFYIEYIEKNFKQNEDLVKIIKKYQLSFGVSLQITCEEEMINFITELANIKNDYLFILIPRFFENKPYIQNLPQNIIFYPILDFYNTIQHCDIHVTAYSTTALEAPSLGVPNILINIGGFAKKYYKNLVELGHTHIVNSPDEFFIATERLTKMNKHSIKLGNSKIFKPDYNKNIKEVTLKLLREI